MVEGSRWDDMKEGEGGKIGNDRDLDKKTVRHKET